MKSLSLGSFSFDIGSSSNKLYDGTIAFVISDLETKVSGSAIVVGIVRKLNRKHNPLQLEAQRSANEI